MTLGAKYDTGKLLFRPLTRGLALPLKLVAAVLSYGAQKYDEDSWQEVPNAAKRYENALDRHINDWKAGKDFDEESGLMHLGHIACNALFLIWFEMKRLRRPGESVDHFFQFNKPPENTTGNTITGEHTVGYRDGDNYVTHVRAQVNVLNDMPGISVGHVIKPNGVPNE